MLMTDDKEAIEAWFRQQKINLGLQNQVELGWSHMKRALGKFDPNGGAHGYWEIRLSEPTFIDLGMHTLKSHGVRNDMLEDTILHELAHALDYKELGTTDHGPNWKRKAKIVGADPTRLAHLPRSVERLLAKYIRYCPDPDCDYKQYLYKRPGSNARDCSCGRCSKDGKFDERYILKIKPNPNQIV